MSYPLKYIFLTVIIILLFFLTLFFGSVSIPCGEVLNALTGNGEGTASFIVIHSRLPMAITALFAGAGLATAGLLLQTAFRNPLAGPSILGITSGASFGVALVMLLFGGMLSAGSFAVGGYAAIIAGAFVGSLAVMGILLMLSTILKNGLMLLITGIMIGYLVSSAITLLNFSASAEGIQGYVMWGMSSFNGVSVSRLPFFCGVTFLGIIIALLLIKPLDLILLGDSYARNLGVNLTKVRNMLLISTGILTAVITAFCGPVSFLGLAVPHISRIFFPTDSHRILIPATLLTGGAIGLLCGLICVVPSVSVLPLNAVTPLIGAPVVIWVLLRKK